MTNKRGWKSIQGFEGLYEINRNGVIRSLQKRNYKNELATRIDRGGYLTVRLCNKGNPYSKYIHRLIAETYIPNPDHKKVVNHKNGDKLDNRIRNLEFVTYSENTLHAYKKGLIKRVKKSLADVCTRVFSGAKKAA